MEGTGRDRRGQHPKHHGCVVAHFEVLADIPDEYKVGLLATPATYTAYIRLSNGAQIDDTKPDVHGMAIKLTGVPGQKVLETEATATTHDFILADRPVFFIRNTEEYVRFIEDFAQSAAQGKRPLKFINWLKEHHPEDVPILLEFSQQFQDSPLTAQYWSQVPYAFGAGGTTVCRYSAVPQEGNIIAPIPAAERDAEYLRRALADHLTVAKQPAKFDFTVQLHADATPDVIDSPTVAWDTPAVRVAEITIPPQKFDSAEQMRFCENLSYTPWHALPDHRPVGQINDVRKVVYTASSCLRHAVNQAPREEPTGSEHYGFDTRLE